MASSRDESPESQSAFRMGTAPKDKQERIRNNQRRSRARRHEHIADLERRLQESHSLCREAELQRAALVEEQQANDCLRTLLSVTGVSKQLVDSFLRQQSAKEHRGSDGPSTMRQLRPKLRVPYRTGPSAFSTSTTLISDDFHSPMPHETPTSPAIDPRSSTSTSQYLRSTPAGPAGVSAPIQDESNYMLEDSESDLDVPTFPLPSTTKTADEYCDDSFMSIYGSSSEDDETNNRTSVARTPVDQCRASADAREMTEVRLTTEVSQPDACKTRRRSNSKCSPSYLIFHQDGAQLAP